MKAAAWALYAFSLDDPCGGYGWQGVMRFGIGFRCALHHVPWGNRCLIPSTLPAWRGSRAMTQRPTLSVGVAVVRRSAMGFREPALIAGLDRRWARPYSLVRGTMLEGMSETRRPTTPSTKRPPTRWSLTRAISKKKRKHGSRRRSA